MSLCDLCNGLTIASLYPPSTYHHAENLAALEASAKDCRLCKMMHWCIEQGAECDHHPQLHFEGAADEKARYGEHEARDMCSVKLQIIPGDWNDLRPERGFTHVGIWMMSRWMVADMTLSVEEGDGLGSGRAVDGEENSFISGRVLVSETPPQAHFDVAKRWLDHCEAKHHECSDNFSKLAELPYRVIRVAEEGQDPTLVNGDTKRARYATLSHCWGTSTVAVTTTETLRIRQNSLPLGTLPKTFREAIQVCRKLGIPYLWIDSICIIQDDKEDWERHSGIMGSIYYESTLTLSATDSPDSSKGLFIARRPYEYCWHDIVTLPATFGDHNGQAYLTGPTWGVYGPPATDVESGVLQTRGWVMQEKYLAARTLHFLAGQMVWVCCERLLGQSGFSESMKNNFRKSTRMQLKAFTKAFERSYRFTDPFDNVGGDSDGDGDCPLDEQEQFKNAKQTSDGEKEAKEAEEDNDASSETSNFVTTLLPPDNERASTIVDLRDPQYQTSSPPIDISRQVDNELYDFLDVATRQTIYHVWYCAVLTYSERRLTFASDKLPALAGIASRVQAITHDQYLAGHWRRELERSLFWQTSTEPNTWTPARVKKYRAPSWSWASVDGSTFWSFPDLAPGQDVPASIEIMEASTEVEGENPFGCVKAGKLTMRAKVLKAMWGAEKEGWIVNGTFADCGEAQYGYLKILSPRGSDTHVAGTWNYDDVINGIMPGPSLTASNATDEVVAPRLVPSAYYMSTSADNNHFYGEEFIKTPLWQRGTYLPEELLLVKGPVRKIRESYRGESDKKEADIDILVLAKADGHDGNGLYRRVGVGSLGSWDESAESVEILTVV